MYRESYKCLSIFEERGQSQPGKRNTHRKDKQQKAKNKTQKISCKGEKKRKKKVYCKYD